MTKTNLLKTLRSHQKQRDTYLATVPQDLRQVVYDNGFCESLEASNQLLTEAYFGEAAEMVLWFLFEYREGFSITEADGTEFVFDSEEQFYEYFEKVTKNET